MEREREDLEDADLVVEKTRGSDDFLGVHGSELVVLEARIFHHSCCHRNFISGRNTNLQRERERERVRIQEDQISDFPLLLYYLFPK
jgi:hypothetical protein